MRSSASDVTKQTTYTMTIDFKIVMPRLLREVLVSFLFLFFFSPRKRLIASVATRERERERGREGVLVKGNFSKRNRNIPCCSESTIEIESHYRILRLRVSSRK